MEELLTIEEVCDLFRISLPTLRKWRREGAIPYIKLGKTIRFSKAAIMELVNPNSNVQKMHI